jgi:hypothetical protein
LNRGQRAIVPKPFDLLASAAAFAREHGIPLTEPSLVQRFTAHATRRLKAALVDPTLIHGTRAENLFEALVVSLGRFRLFKREDVGVVHAAAATRAPDFRLVLNDGEQWLIEVKNVRCEEPRRQRTRLSAAYLASLRAYAETVGTPLRLALYWSRWSIWTLISPDGFLTKDGGVTVTMEQALMASELGRLGDVSMATVAPLRLIFCAARDKPRRLRPDGQAEFTIGSATMYSDETELTDARDRQLAMVLFQFGEWPLAGPLAIMEDGEIAGVEFLAAPEEPTDQGFEPVGWASRIFSRYFASRTVEGDQVVQLSGEAVPEWFAPLSAWDFANSRLPLWLFNIQPTTAADTTALNTR